LHPLNKLTYRLHSCNGASSLSPVMHVRDCTSLACVFGCGPASCGSSRWASVPGPPSLVLVRRLVLLPALPKRKTPRYLAFARWYPQRRHDRSARANRRGTSGL